MKLKMYNSALLLAIATSTLVFTGCFEKKLPSEKKTYNQVEVAVPAKRMIEIWDEYTAKLEGEKSVEIRSRVAGYLDKIHFQDGDFVEAGSVLFEIDARPFQAIVEANKAVVKEVESKIELAKNNLSRAEELYSSNAISKEVLETRKSELSSQEASLLNAKAKLRDAQLNLEFTKITSPISGYVSRRRVDAGNLIDNSTTLMATVVARDTIYAYFNISERDVIRYTENGLFKEIDTIKRKGPPVNLTLLDELEPSHFGELTYMDNSLSSSSIELRAEIDNKNGKLFPGMFAKILLRGGQPRECLLVPELAIGTDLVERYVLVVNDKNIVERRGVEVGEMIGNLQIIEKGLKPDEKVIINGLVRAVVGKPVTPIEKVLK